SRRRNDATTLPELRVGLPCAVPSHCPRTARARAAMQHVGKAHAAQRVVDGRADALPVARHRAKRLTFATRVAETAFGQADRAVQRLDDFRQRNILGRTRKAITSRGTTERIHEPRLRKAFQQLADRGCLKMGFRAHLHRGQHLARMARKAGHHHGGVIGKAADTKHGFDGLRIGTNMVLITTRARKNASSRVLHALALPQTKRAPTGARSWILLIARIRHAPATTCTFTGAFTSACSETSTS